MVRYEFFEVRYIEMMEMWISQFVELGSVRQALLATCFTWFVTALGAATVFLFKQVNRKGLDGMLGFAAGVMIAASYWFLLAPAIQMTRETNDVPAWLEARSFA